MYSELNGTHLETTDERQLKQLGEKENLVLPPIILIVIGVDRGK